MENSFFGMILLKFMLIVRQSGLYRLYRKCFDGIQAKWFESHLHSVFFEKPFKNNIETSMIYKIMESPFRLLNKIADQYDFLAVKQSIVLKEIKNYLNYILEIHTRFIGSFLLVFSLFYAARLGEVTPIVLVGGVTGAIGVVLNLSGRKLLIESLLCSWFLGFIDLKIEPVEESIPENKSFLYGSIIGGITGALMMTVGTIYALAIVAGLTGFCFMMYKAEYALYIMILLAPILPSTLVMMICGVVALSVIARNLLDREKRWYLDDIGFLLMCLLGIYAISVIVSFTRMSSFAVWIVYLIFIGFYVILTQLLTSREMILRVMKLFVLTGTVVAIYGLMQYVFGWGINENWIDPTVFTTITKRAYSTLENPNILGEYLVLTTMLGIGIMVTRQTLFSKIGYLVCNGIMFVCLLATYSRGCWIGIGLAGAIFITFYNAKLWLLSVPVLMVAPFILPENVMIRLMSIGNMEDTSTAIRVKIWLSSLRMGGDFILTGIGLGTAAYAYAYPFYAYYYIPAHHSHNAFFQVLIEGGIIGLVLFVGIIIRFFKQMTLCYNKTKETDKEVAFLVLAVATGVVGFFVQGMFDYSFYNYRMVVILWLFVSFGTALARVTTKALNG